MVVIVLLSDFVISIGLEKLYEINQYGESGGVINYYLQGEETPELLIMGSSRSHRHVVPDSFACSTFNLSHHGMRIPFNAALINILAQEKKLPKVLLLHIEMGSFAFYEGQDIAKNDVQNLRYFYTKNDKVKEYINGLSGSEQFKYLFRSYRFNGRIPSLIKNVIKTKRSKPHHDGFEPLYPTKQDSARIELQIKLQAEIKRPDAPIFISKKAVSFLNDVIKTCKEENIRLVLFNSPRFLPPNEGQIMASDYLTNLCSEKQIEFLNFDTVEILALKKRKYWRDFEHMNINGASIFTSYLKQQIELCN